MSQRPYGIPFVPPFDGASAPTGADGRRVCGCPGKTAKAFVSPGTYF